MRCGTMMLASMQTCELSQKSVVQREREREREREGQQDRASHLNSSEGARLMPGMWL